MTTPPDFGGTEFEEGLLEDLGVEPEEHGAPRPDALVAEPYDDNEAHVTGQTCARCGKKIEAEQDSRRRADGNWVHEVCPLSSSG